MNEHYAAVLRDLRERRSALDAAIIEVDTAIAALQRMANMSVGGMPVRPVVSIPPGAGKTAITVELAAQTRFANMSVRWGVLWQLAEFTEDFAKTGEIAKALLAGGYKSDATRFGNMVSAVLSQMKAKGEVETNDDGGYRLTEAGRNTWALIRQGHKFRAAISPSEQSLLSVQ
jgi:hypothetical protein